MQMSEEINIVKVRHASRSRESAAADTPLSGSTAERRRVRRSSRAPRLVLPGVLVVEKDPNVQARIARDMALAGSRVVGTGSPEAALELVSQWPVDVAVVGDELSGLGSIALIRDLRRVRPKLSVVMMLRESSALVERQARRAGASAVTTMEAASETLLRMLKNSDEDSELIPAE